MTGRVISYGKGHVVAGGETFPVSDVVIAQGKIWVTFRITGPHKALSGPITVFGADGIGVWQGRPFDTGPVPRGAVWRFDYSLTLKEIYGANDGEPMPVVIEHG
ncbi:MAG: hypothetical protein ACRDOK_04550 [Streptosporangiaceae bacterium]